MTKEAGMYAVHDKSYPQVKIGKYTICRQNEKKVWIEVEDGEGGAFPDDIFEKAIKAFFNNHF